MTEPHINPLPQFPAAEVDLMQRVKRLAGPYLSVFAPQTSVPISWWAATTSLESGQWLIHDTLVPPRLESRIHEQLEALQSGASDHFLHWTLDDLVRAQSKGATLGQLASSHGLTQVLGYEAIDLGHTVDDLNDPERHYQVAGLLLAKDIQHFDLSPLSDFEAMLRCWNGGHPTAATFDPHYVHNGLLRMKIWDALEAAAPANVL